MSIAFSRNKEKSTFSSRSAYVLLPGLIGLNYAGVEQHEGSFAGGFNELCGKSSRLESRDGQLLWTDGMELEEFKVC